MRRILLYSLPSLLLFAACKKKDVEPYAGDFTFTNAVTWINHTSQATGGDTVTYNGRVKVLSKTQLDVNCWAGATQTAEGCYDKPVYSGGSFSPVIDPETGVLDFSDYSCTYGMNMTGHFTGHDEVEISYTVPGNGTGVDSTYHVHGVRVR